MDGYVRKRPKHGKAVVWENDITGEYRIPPTDDAPMPSRYQIRGFVRKELTYWEHKAFCKRHGLVNHALEDVRNDGDALGKNKWGY